MIAPKICWRCGREYTPTVGSQRYCNECRDIERKEQKRAARSGNWPAYMGTDHKTRPPCCVCGKPSMSSWEGQWYCDNHWQRLYKSRKRKSRKHAVRENTVEVDGDTAHITAGNSIIIADSEDCDIIREHYWHIWSGYPASMIDGKSVRLSRYILEKHGRQTDGEYVKYINGDPLDVRKANLRLGRETSADRQWDLAADYQTA